MITRSTLFNDLPDYMKEKYYKDQRIQLFHGEKLVTDIVIKDRQVSYKKYGEKFDSLFMSDEPIDPEYIYAVFTTRVMDNYGDKRTEQWLKYYGVKEYDVYELVRSTHGADFEDNYYFKFDEEINNNIKLEDLKKNVAPTMQEFKKRTGEEICFY